MGQSRFWHSYFVDSIHKKPKFEHWHVIFLGIFLVISIVFPTFATKIT